MSEAGDEQYPTELDERVVRIELMRADTDLKRIQIRGEVWRMTLGLLGVVVAAMGAGAGLLAATIAAFKWWYGVP